jgi:hypothetical protein
MKLASIAAAVLLAHFLFAQKASAQVNTPNVGLGIEPARTSSVSNHVKQASSKFMVEIEQTRNMPKDKTTDGLFEYTIDREKFLGEPVVALIGHNASANLSNYLIILHYNIPPVKSSLLPVKYGFARLGVRFLAFNQGDAQDPNKVDLLSIYPTNELLDINHTDKGTNTLTIQPQYMGASGGSYQYQKERTDVYNFQLPTVIGTANRYGEAAWTYYPAKQQPLILGSKTAFAVVSLPASRTRLRLQVSLDYQLKRLKLIPFPLRTLQDSLDFKLVDAPSVEDALAMHTADLPDNVRDKIKACFLESHQYAFNTGSDKNDYILDVTSGKYFRVDQTGAHRLILPKE